MNPDHLFLGTPADNTADMIAKNRGRYAAHSGEQHGRAKLLQHQVIDIRSRHGQTRKTLAEEFGISVSQVDRIRKRRSWNSHLEAA
ncbi:MAG: hypothetical protein MN733_10340 [Nitrososphaera sp.]|nr:hypothetical protein [Nitrososphaera sp.]